MSRGQVFGMGLWESKDINAYKYMLPSIVAELLQELRCLFPGNVHPVWTITGPYDTRKMTDRAGRNHNLLHMNAEARRVAKLQGWAVIDNEAMVLADTRAVRMQAIMSDGVHYSASYNELITDVLLAQHCQRGDGH